MKGEERIKESQGFASLTADFNKKNEQVELCLKTVTKLGFPIYALIGRYRKVSRLKPEIPCEVIIRVCNQYVKYKDSIHNQWPWFLRVLKAETEQYMAEQNVRESAEFKKPGLLSLSEILKRASA